MVLNPAIILVQPQLGENIGKTARAMLNFGLTDLRLVAPRDGWPNPSAGPAASGADAVLDHAKVFATVAEAVEDCHTVFAATVRDRDMPKPVATPQAAASIVSEHDVSGLNCGFLFGREASGLSNDDVSHADVVLTVPVNPSFGSLNLAQAVILVAYELFNTACVPEAVSDGIKDAPADKAETEGLHHHLVEELSNRGYFRSKGREATQQRTLRNLILNAGFSSQEVQTLRGVIKSLSRPKC